jgi:CHAT domain-containing protein
VNTPTKRILAIAPGYDFSAPEISEYIRKAESGLPELQGTYKESKAIKRMLGGRLLAGNEATEARFKKLAPDYRILHLAMHTIPDSNNSLNSSLVFTPGVDRREDGLLFGHEVYNLSLNSWLTVLSACETGAGQMASGEGILSFGRAFIVAGCPNLIMTMWTVDDRSSQEIMVGFYKNLQGGAGIADALQKSKITYLQNADQLHAHPHYWAGFIELGQNQVLDLPGRKPGLGYLALFLMATVSIIAYLQAKKNPRRSGDMVEKE